MVGSADITCIVLELGQNLILVDIYRPYMG
ncbi:hypothetical protein DSUL_140091 [Desulfovibrionales bacterium]